MPTDTEDGLAAAPLDPQAVERIEARLEAATPGPWSWKTRRSRSSWHPDGAASYGNDLIRGTSRTDFPGQADISFVAHAPDDIRTLLTEVQRQRSVIENFTHLHALHSRIGGD